jgi:hypothetical protein
MADSSKIAKNLQAFQMAINVHDRENTCTAWGIGLAYFDLERLGFDEGETILPGIVIQGDDGVTGNFRVLCDGAHDADLEESEEEIVDAVADDRGILPIHIEPRI